MALNVQTITADLPSRIIIHGQEGVGKTSIAARFPNPVFIRTEDGCPVGVEMQTFPFCETYEAVKAALIDLAQEEHDFQTVVIDSADPLEALIWQDVCTTNKWSSIEAPGYGKGYVEADNWWKEITAALDYLRRERGMTALILAHSNVERIEDPRVPSYTSYQIRLHKRGRGIMQDWADAIGFLAHDINVTAEEQGFNKKRNRADGGSTRWIHWEARPSFTAKSRYSLPPKMMVAKDFDFAGQLGPHLPQAGDH